MDEYTNSTALSYSLPTCPEDVYTPDQIAYRVYANLPISIIGILSNILNVRVFADAEMRTVLVNHFLLALSVSDLLLLACNIFFLVMPVIVVRLDSFFWNDLFPAIIRYSYPLALTTQTSGVYLTVLVSVHRFLGVCHPFKAKRWVTRHPVHYAIAGSVMFSVLVNVPTWLELSVVPCYSATFARVSRQIALAPFHEMTYILIKKTVLYTLIMFCFPFTLLIFVNWRILMALRESKTLRTMHTYSTSHHQFRPTTTSLGASSCEEDGHLKAFHLLKETKYSEVFQTFGRMSEQNFLKVTHQMMKPKCTNATRDRSITLMLLAIVSLFISCNGLAFCNSIVESVMLIGGESAEGEGGPKAAEERQQLIKLFERSVEISNVLITLNSSTSTLVYLIFSSKYRLVLKSLLGLRKREKVNRVAVTTALAAQRAVELSLIPEEADNRQRRKERVAAGNGGGGGEGGGGGNMAAIRKGRLFRSQTNTSLGKSSLRMATSESNLRLMDNEDQTHQLSVDERPLGGNVEMRIFRQ